MKTNLQLFMGERMKLILLQSKSVSTILQHIKALLAMADHSRRFQKERLISRTKLASYVRADLEQITEQATESKL